MHLGFKKKKKKMMTKLLTNCGLRLDTILRLTLRAVADSSPYRYFFILEKELGLEILRLPCYLTTDQYVM